MTQGFFYSIPSLQQYATTANLYPSLCTMKVPTNSTDPLGQVDRTDLTPVAGLVNIPCAMASQVTYRPDASATMRTQQEIDNKGERHLLLNAYYPAVSQTQIAQVDGVLYEVMAVERDSQLASQTRLSVRYWVQ